MSNIYLAVAIGFAAWLGILSAKHKKATRIMIWLSLPIAWAMTKILPEFITVVGSKKDTLTYYISMYEGFTDQQKHILHTFLIVFIVMRIAAWIYISWFVEGKVETLRERKARILKYYNIRKDEMNW